MNVFSKLAKAATVGFAAAAATKRGLDALDDTGSALAGAADRARRIVIDIAEEAPDAVTPDDDGSGSTLVRTVVTIGLAGAAWKAVTSLRSSSDDPVGLVKDSVGAVTGALAGRTPDVDPPEEVVEAIPGGDDEAASDGDDGAADGEAADGADEAEDGAGAAEDADEEEETGDE